MNKVTTSIFLILFAAVKLFALTWEIPEETAQGAVVRVILLDASSHEGSVKGELRINGKTWSSGESFSPFPENPDESWTGVILLGVPSDIPVGQAKVHLDFSGLRDSSGTAAFQDSEIRQEIEIQAFDFIREEIPLNSAMSDLRQDDGAEKAKQWRILYGILTTFNPEDVFLTESFSLPVRADARRTSFYGDRRIFLYTDGNTARSVHHGIDFSGVPGTEIRAAGRGKVVFSGNRILSGETITIEHLPGVYSSYYHMKDRFLEVGDDVADQQLIGTIGATGLVTGAHLHWEIRVNGVSVSPDSLMESPLIDKNRIISMME